MPNPNLSEIMATTIDSRSGVIQDNTIKNNALLMRLNAKGKIKTYSGGDYIIEELSFAENPNFGWYSGADVLPTASGQVLSAAQFTPKLASVQVIITGEDLLKNSGEEKIIDLMDARLENAESTMMNNICQGLYSDGTGYGGKQITGLDLAVPSDPTTGTYGGINRANFSFWRSQVYDPASTPTASTIQGYMNTLWASCVLGADAPDLIMAGSTIWATYMASLQTLQRFTNVNEANLGFPSVKFMNADVVLDGGIGGFLDATTMFFLNTNHIRLRPHAERNMKSLPRRTATNQDAEVAILGWCGNLTCRSARTQGRLIGS